MKTKDLKDKAFPRGLLLLALIMLFNPNINIIDILPDFIGYLIISRLIIHAARRVPFFEEARLGFLKLALISFMKYPAFILMVIIRGKNTLDNDIITLFSFAFAVIELIVAVSSINNLFAGLSYLGRRTGAPSVIGENPSADFLRALTLVFTVAKCVLYSLPEFLLLTTVGDAGSPTSMMSAARFYPAALVFAQVLGYAIGAAWLAFFARYLGRVRRSGEFYPAVMELSTDEKEEQISRIVRKKRVLTGIKILIPAALFSFDFSVKNLGGINVLPHFLIGILLLFAIFSFAAKRNRLFVITASAGGIYTVFSLITWLLGIDYHDTYSHTAALLYKEAREAFVLYAALSVIEAILLIVFLAGVTLLLVRFIKTHTGKTPPNVIDPLAADKELGEYSPYDKKYHNSLSLKAFIFLGVGILSTAAKLVHVFTDNERVFDGGALIPNVAPWLGSLTVIISVVWAVYTLYFTNILKEDFEMKYSEIKISHN